MRRRWCARCTRRKSTALFCYLVGDALTLVVDVLIERAAKRARRDQRNDVGE